MLSINLKPGESIVIGDDITVSMVEKSGQTARLQIAAPKAMHISKVDTKMPTSHYAATHGLMTGNK